MNKKIISLIAFACLVLSQLFIPIQMILGKENTLQTGTLFKFKTAPVDPYDPFRGKYITLSYEIEECDSDTEWLRGEQVYVTITEDSLGFAKIASLTKQEPEELQTYFEAEIRRGNHGYGNLWIDFPFDRFYMEESKAKSAEDTYRYASREERLNAYALVAIKKGDAVVKDVLIDNVRIKDYITEKSYLD